MLLEEDARPECLLVVLRQHWDDRLSDNRAGVDAAIDKMDGATGEARAIRERLPLRMKTGKAGQETRVDIHDARAANGCSVAGTLRRASVSVLGLKRVDECRREEPHETGEADEVDLVRAQPLDELRVVA